MHAKKSYVDVIAGFLSFHEICILILFMLLFLVGDD
jgi:hypothetical protein